MKEEKFIERLDRQIKAIDEEVSELTKTAAQTQAALEDRLSRVREKLRERDELRQKLVKDRERELPDIAAIEFLDCARELDKAETVADMQRLEKLAANLAFAGRLTQTRYEARRLNFDRMRRLGDGQMFRPPFTSWSKLAECWLKAAPEEKAA